MRSARVDDSVNENPYATVCIVLLCLAHVLSMLSDMDHAPMHGDSVRQYCICQIGQTGLAERVDSALRES